MHEPIWSPSVAREAIRADLARLRKSTWTPAAEQLLVEALRDDVAVNSFGAFKDLAKKLVEAYGIPLATTWTAEQHVVEAAVCRARAREWSDIAEKAARDKDDHLVLLATHHATQNDRSADHHAACARELGGAP